MLLFPQDVSESHRPPLSEWTAVYRGPVLAANNARLLASVQARVSNRVGTHTMKGFFGIGLAALSAAVLSIGESAGASAASSGPRTASVGTLGDDLLPRRNEKVIDMLGDVLAAASASFTSNGDLKGSSILKIAMVMRQAKDLAGAARQYAVAEDDVLVKARAVAEATSSVEKNSSEVSDTVKEFTESQLLADGAARHLLESAATLREAVLSQELPRPFKEEEERGVEVLEQVTAAAQEATRRVAEDSKRRFQEIAKVLDAVVTKVKAELS